MQETHDTKSFVFDVPAELQDTFAYDAGQFCTFRVRFGDEDLLRCYSMSSSPHTDAELTTTVKRVAGGRVSNWMLDEVAEGDVLALTRPAGVFTLRDRRVPIVAFSGGSGITPIISVIKSALATTDRSVRLLYANRDADSVIFAAELNALRGAYPGRLDVVHHLDTEHGFVHSNGAMEFVGTEPTPTPTSTSAGPGPFMDVVEDALAQVHVPSDHVFIERFAFAAAARLDEPLPLRRAVSRRTRARDRRHRAGRARARGALPRGRDVPRDRPPRRTAGAVLVRGRQLCDVHGPAPGRRSEDACEQRVDAGRGRGGLGAHVPSHSHLGVGDRRLRVVSCPPVSCLAVDVTRNILYQEWEAIR